MSSQKQCIPPSCPAAPASPASPPPPERPEASQPLADWDESAAFRETTLQHFTQPGDADTLRRLGVLLHDMALELAPLWPIPPGSGTTLQLRAAAADLRFLEHYLAHAGHDRYVSSLTPKRPASPSSPSAKPPKSAASPRFSNGRLGRETSIPGGGRPSGRRRFAPSW